MTPEEIAAREIALWREHVGWRPAMLDAYSGERVAHICEGTTEPVLFEIAEVWGDDSFANNWQPARLSVRAVPDFTDNATIGVLVGVMRERWQDPGAHTRPEPHVMDDGWRYTAYVDPPLTDDDEWVDAMALEREPLDFDGPTEALAVLEAIAAAPEVTS